MIEPKFTFKFPYIKDFESVYYFSYNSQNKDQKIFYPHLHDDIELFILIEGDVSFAVEQNVYKLFPCDIILTKPNEIHSLIFNSNSRLDYVCFFFNQTSSILLSSLVKHDFGKDNLISPSLIDKKNILDICNNIYDISQKNDQLLKITLLTNLLYIINKNIKSTHSQQITIPKQFKEILEYINNNFSQIRTIEDILEKFYISRSTLARLFNKHLHTSPNYYIETKKLAHARILLKQGKSVMEACLNSGFSDCANFIRLFKNRFNITPNKYKKFKQTT